MLGSTLLLFGINALFGDFGSKKEKLCVPQAVKIGNKNERLQRELATWISVRRRRALEKGIATADLIEHDASAKRFANLVKISEDLIALGAKCSHWLVFDDFIDESDYLQLVQLNENGVEETRITITR